MEKKYKQAYDFVGTLRVLMSFIAIFYIIFWFLKFIDFPLINYIEPVFRPVMNLLGQKIEWTMAFEDKIVDMMPLVAAGAFWGIYLLLQPFFGIIEKMENKHRLNVIAERKLEEKLVNENLKEIFKNKTMEYSKFAILFSLEIKGDAITTQTGESKKEIIKKEYMKIVNMLRQKYATCKAIMPDKLFIIYNNFALFDDFLKDILSEVKQFSKNMAENGSEINFSILVDALKETDKVTNTLDLLEKISTFNYVNKAITTSSFNIRYKLNSGKNQYILDSMGISRFFEKENDGISKSIDFELFNLKNSKKKQV